MYLIKSKKLETLLYFPKLRSIVEYNLLEKS